MSDEAKKIARKEANLRYRAKHSAKVKEHDKERHQLKRLQLKCNKDKREAYDEYKRKERERKRKKKQANAVDNTGSPGATGVTEASLTSTTTTTTPESAFRHNCTKMRSMSRAEKALPPTPRRQGEVVRGLAKKLNINIVGTVKKPGPARVELSDDQIQWLVSKQSDLFISRI